MSPAEKCLNRWTGYGRKFWLRAVEELIEKNWERGTNKMKNGTDWISELSVLVKPFASVSTDGNIAQSLLVSLILQLWVSAIGRAKSRDPKRSLKERKLSRKATHDWQLVVIDAMTDEALDRGIFRQEWELP